MKKNTTINSIRKRITTLLLAGVMILEGGVVTASTVHAEGENGTAPYPGYDSSIDWINRYEIEPTYHVNSESAERTNVATIGKEHRGNKVFAKTDEQAKSKGFDLRGSDKIDENVSRMDNGHTSDMRRLILTDNDGRAMYYVRHTEIVPAGDTPKINGISRYVIDNNLALVPPKMGDSTSAPLTFISGGETNLAPTYRFNQESEKGKQLDDEFLDRNGNATVYLMPVDTDGTGTGIRDWYWCANPAAAVPFRNSWYVEMPMELAPQTQFDSAKEVMYIANVVMENSGMNKFDEDAMNSRKHKGLPAFKEGYEQMRTEYLALLNKEDLNGAASFDKRLTRQEVYDQLVKLLNGGTIAEGTIHEETISEQSDANTWTTMTDLSNEGYWEASHTAMLGIEYAFLKYIQGMPMDGMDLFQAGSNNVGSGFSENVARTNGARPMARLMVAYVEAARAKGLLNSVTSDATFSTSVTKKETLKNGNYQVTVKLNDISDAESIQVRYQGIDNPLTGAARDGKQISLPSVSQDDNCSYYTFENTLPNELTFTVSKDNLTKLRDNVLITKKQNKATIAKAYVNQDEIYLDETSGHYVAREFVGADYYNQETATEGRERSQTVFKLTPEKQSLNARININEEVKPSIHTTVSADGNKSTADQPAETTNTKVKVVDTVTYQNLTAGKTYTVSGKLYDQTDGKILDQISGQKTFTPTAADGSVDVDFGTLELTAGHTYVVFEYLYEGEKAEGTVVVNHEEKDDKAQTFVVKEENPTPTPEKPSIHTTVSADGNKSTADQPAETTNTKVKVVDTVTYQNLTAGKTYTVSGKLYDQTDDKILDKISGQKTFTPTAADGSVDVDFGTLELTAGHTYVVFEYLYEGEKAEGTVVVNHEEKDDKAQTFVVKEENPTPTPEKPSIHTTVSADGNKSTADQPAETTNTKVKVVDTVTYKNLTAGKTHTVSGKLYDQTDGKILDQISGQKTFTPTAADGSVDVDFGTLELTAGHTYVVFEYLYEGEKAEGTVVANHEEKDDKAQTFVVKEENPTPTPETPSIHTTVSADGNKSTADQPAETTNTKVKVVDTVTYQNLTAGKTYTVSGKLYDQTDGKILDQISGQMTFTPTAADGSVDVDFGTLELTAGHTYVVFEYLYEGETASGEAVASHEDKNDTAQTFVVQEKSEIEKISIPVKKEWSDDKNKTAVQFELLRNDEVVRTITLDANNNWSGSFDDLDKTDANGVAYTYTVREVGRWVNVRTTDTSGKVTIKILFMKESTEGVAEGQTTAEAGKPEIEESVGQESVSKTV